MFHNIAIQSNTMPKTAALISYSNLRLIVTSKIHDQSFD